MSEGVVKYVRSKVLNYLIDTGLTVTQAKNQLDEMDDDEVRYIYANEPYFEEDGY